MGATNKQIGTIAETFIKLGRVGGASMADVNGALVQFSQGLSSGRLQGDEFRSISERLPLVMRALSAELNVSVGELKKLGTEGKITSDVMANAMINAAKDVDGQFAKLPLTFEQATNNFRTMATEFLRSKAVVAVIDGLTRALTHVTENVQAFVNDMAIFTAGMSDAQVKMAKLVTGVGLLAFAIRALMLSNPFTAIALGAVTAVGLIITNWNKVKSFFEFTIPIFLAKANSAWYQFSYEIVKATRGIVEPVIGAFNDLFNGILTPYNAIMTALGKATIEIDAGGAAIDKLSTIMDGLNSKSLEAELSMYDLQDAQAAAKNAAVELTTELEVTIPTFAKLSGAADKTAKAAKKAADELKKAGETLVNGFGRAIEDGIINAAKGGKDAFSNMAKSILNDIARMIIQMKIVKPLMDALKASSTFGSFFGSARGNVFPDGVGNSGPLTTYARGGVVSGPMTAYASGGIISSRTQAGSSLMGEAGGGRSEAVVPLRRHGGSLGVGASPVNVNVINNAGAEVAVSESTGNDGSRTLDIMIEQKVRNSFATGGMDKVMKGRYGIKGVGA
jgi:tape measure domain-containing protein